MDSGALVISLDFELNWGVRDKRRLSDYGRNILGGRKAIPLLLDLFATRRIAATWATVGLAFCGTKDELIAALPPLRPDYADPRLTPYDSLDTVGRDKASDPYHFGQSLVRKIASYDGQEIGTHSFSHFYCLEDGGSAEAFAADLVAAKAIAARIGITPKTIVFPRNQLRRERLRVAREGGLVAFRGNPRTWFYRASREEGQTLPKRAARLADTYMAIAGQHVHEPGKEEGLVDVAASRFLRPVRGAWYDRIQLARIVAEVTAAARANKLFHLWWHPHNFGAQPEENFAFLVGILDAFERFRDQYGMKSLNMLEVAEGAP